MAPSVKQTNSALANRLVLQGFPPSFVSFASPLPDTNGPANATPLVLAAQAPGGGGLHGRGQRLLYAYDAVGNLTNVDYPVSPDISLSYDALNRLTNMVDAVGTTHYTWTAASRLLTEDGPWNDDTVTYNYTAQLRTGMSVEQPNALPWLQTYDYDGAKRLKSTTSPAGEFDYDYDPLRHLLVQKLQLPGGSVITNDFDANARLTGTWLRNSSGTNLDSEEYTYNLGNERARLTRTEGSYMDYTYDPIGQLRTALGSDPSGSIARLNEQFKYGYDKAHNLQARTEMGTLPPGIATPHAYYHADGNGNITALVNNLQLIVAKYLYDPFGNTLSLSGPLAEANLYRFSSKEFHPASSLIFEKLTHPKLQQTISTTS